MIVEIEIDGDIFVPKFSHNINEPQEDIHLDNFTVEINGRDVEKFFTSEGIEYLKTLYLEYRWRRL